MKIYMILVISCCCTVLLIGCWGANKDIERYEQTASTFLRLVNGMQEERQISVPELEAWGRNLLVETNASSIVYISQGTDVKDLRDDIRLQIERDTGSYSISYTYDSHHYFSAGFFETKGH